MKIHPINDRVAVEVIENQSKTETGIYIPESAVEKPQTGKVIGVGQGVLSGKARIPLAVKKGDTVLFAKYSGTELKDGNKKILLIRESDILAVVEE